MLVDTETTPYSDKIIFNNPISMESNGRVFEENEDIEQYEREENYESIIRECKDIEQNLTATHILNATQLKYEGAEGYHKIAFTLNKGSDESKTFIFDTIGALKKLASFNGIPWNFAKENPTHLTKENFSYRMESSEVCSLIFIHEKNEVTINCSFNEDGSDPTSITGYRVLTFMKKDKKHPGKELRDYVPLWGNAVQDAVDSIKKIDPQVKVWIQTQALGYTGSNKGMHFARIVLDSPEYRFQIGEDYYNFAVNLHSTFMDSSPKNQIGYSFLAFRETCSNGMGVSWSDAYLKNAAETYAQRNSSNEIDLAFAKDKFIRIFNKDGISIPISHMNYNPNEDLLMFHHLEEFLSMSDFFKQSMGELTNRLPKIEDKGMDHFIETCQRSSRNLKLGSEILISTFIMEFITDRIRGDGKFATPLDIVNFLTFISRSFSSEVQNRVESNSIAFATSLKESIETGNSSVSVYQDMLGRINPKVLVAVQNN